VRGGGGQITRACVFFFHECMKSKLLRSGVGGVRHTARPYMYAYYQWHITSLCFRLPLILARQASKRAQSWSRTNWSNSPRLSSSFESTSYLGGTPVLAHVESSFPASFQRRRRVSRCVYNKRNSSGRAVCACACVATPRATHWRKSASISASDGVRPARRPPR